ncbi:oligosaccharide flippase family protein [Thiolinea disciformis]|uniref:oligosaccharide flippase family protein n=1 Tax=Thiolinea disciformis TaxID=125614 RepID=UPI000362BB94|nr:oligosaccharide flippase family protein [Thiolinea disciformis]
MKLNNPSLLWQTAFSTIARFAGVGLNFLVAIIITRNLPVNEAGMLFMLMTLVTGVALFSRVGLEQWIVKEVASLPEDNLAATQLYYLKSAYRLLAITTFISALLWLIASPIFKPTLFDNEIHLSLLWTAALGVVFFNIVIIHSAFLKATHHISESLIVQNALPAVTMLISIGVFWPLFAKQQNYLWIYTISLILAGLISWYWLRQWRPVISQSPSSQAIKQVLVKSLPLAPVSMFAFLMLWADTLMTGLLLKNEDVALYNVAARLSFVSAFFLGALDATIYPRLLRLHKQNPATLKAFFWKATLLVIVILSAVTLLLIIIGKPILAIFSETYIKASLTLSILLVAQLVRGFSLTFSFMFIMQEKVKILNVLLFLALLINIIANLFLIPHYGIEGAAAATLLANMALTGSVILFFTKQRLLHEAL